LQHSFNLFFFQTPQGFPGSAHKPKRPQFDFSAVGLALGDALGAALGRNEGVAVGLAVGDALGAALGRNEGAALGLAVGDALGAALGRNEGAGKTVNGSLDAIKKNVEGIGGKTVNGPFGAILLNAETSRMCTLNSPELSGQALPLSPSFGGPAPNVSVPVVLTGGPGKIVFWPFCANKANITFDESVEGVNMIKSL
jgi:hypothetical protein